MTSELKLKVIREKSKAANREAVKFLGMTIARKRAVLSAKSMQRALEKVMELIPRRTHAPLEEQIEQVNR